MTVQFVTELTLITFDQINGVILGIRIGRSRNSEKMDAPLISRFTYVINQTFRA